MFKWLTRIGSSISSTPDKNPETDQDSIQFAVAILLVEIMHADHELSDKEKSTIINILAMFLGVDKERAHNIFLKADKHMENAVSLQKYTSLINSSFDYRKKLDLIHCLWQVAYSDNMLDKYEEYLIRRLADLLYISHGDFIKAKHLACD